MKAFAIFPVVSVFIITFGVLKNQSNFNTKVNLLFSLLMAVVTGGLFIGGLIVFPEFGGLLILSNVVFALILIPMLTFTINDSLPIATGKILWLRLFGIGLLSVAITGVLFGVSMFFAVANNPMEAGPK